MTYQGVVAAAFLVALVGVGAFVAWVFRECARAFVKGY